MKSISKLSTLFVLVVAFVINGCISSKRNKPLQFVDDKISDKGTLVFQSGFEESCKVVPFGNKADKIVGKDNTLREKNDWVKDLDSANRYENIYLNYTGGDSTKRFAKIIPEPGNPKNKVLWFWVNDSWIASENQQKARAQLEFYGIKEGYKEFYQSVRVFLHPDFNALKSYPHKITWLTLSEFWNNEWFIKGEKYGFRVTLGIGKPTEQNSELNFILNAEDAGMKEVWRGNNTDVKVPIGKWFTMEYYFKEGDKGTGRFWMAITPAGEKKQMVFDVTNYTHNTKDTAPDGLTGYNPLKLYTSKEIIAFIKNQSKTLQIYWDDFKIWKNRKPSS